MSTPNDTETPRSLGPKPEVALQAVGFVANLVVQLLQVAMLAHDILMALNSFHDNFLVIVINEFTNVQVVLWEHD